MIDQLPHMSDISDELVQRALLSTCVELNIEHPLSLQYQINAIKSNDF